MPGPVEWQSCDITPTKNVNNLHQYSYPTARSYGVTVVWHNFNILHAICTIHTQLLGHIVTQSYDVTSIRMYAIYTILTQLLEPVEWQESCDITWEPMMLWHFWWLTLENVYYHLLLQLPDDEETHRCILDFQSMRQMYTHEEVEQVMHQLGWKALAKQGGWRRYFKGADASSPHGLATIAKLPARSFVDAPKHIILDFVKSVNRRENRNVLCCWWELC